MKTRDILYSLLVARELIYDDTKVKVYTRTHCNVVAWGFQSMSLRYNTVKRSLTHYAKKNKADQ